MAPDHTDDRQPDDNAARQSHVWVVDALPRRRARNFEIIPDGAQSAALAQELGIDAARKIRFTGALNPLGKADWHLDGMLGATVIQPCVSTLAPVTTRIDEPVARIYRADYQDTAEAGSEQEMTADDTEEPLGRVIDLWEVMVEALTLAVPAYPRATEAGSGDLAVAPPGVTPMRDEDTKPFAGLAALKAKLEKGD